MADSSTKVPSASFFLLSALGQIHLVKKKIDDAQTQNLCLGSTKMCLNLIDTSWSGNGGNRGVKKVVQSLQ